MTSSVTGSVSSAQLRDQLSDVLGRVAYGHERVGLTRHGKLAAVVIGVDDLELLERLETAQDAELFTAAKAADDGERIGLDELRAELDA